MRPLLFLKILFLLFIVSCNRFNRVAVVLRNDTDIPLELVTSRFGDSLHIIKDLGSGQRSKVLTSNQTYGKNFVKIISKKGDTLITYPLNRHGEKYYYEGKILVRLILQKRTDGTDTLVTRSRRRLF
jgi:hypothetical protein